MKNRTDRRIPLFSFGENTATRTLPKRAYKSTILATFTGNYFLRSYPEKPGR